MSSNSNCNTPERSSPSSSRRQFLGRVGQVAGASALIPLAPLLGHAGLAHAAEGPPVEGLMRWGSGDFSRLGISLYRATLWASADGAPGQPPLALQLVYKRGLSSSIFVQAGVQEMRRLGASDAQMDQWEPLMAKVLPGVSSGDTIWGVWQGDSARFWHNSTPTGQISAAGFCPIFFGIWLSEKTSAPDLRKALLQRG
ncbi:chalcone isomerase family protein [Amphibiibacter pelophylacis]|uniref:Chalcone isomerase family protein n=1 Tax=Amphibiibacter pelophylacis TaxID=1799477 RepID=A0ACC6P1Y9_9BURK